MKDGKEITKGQEVGEELDRIKGRGEEIAG